MHVPDIVCLYACHFNYRFTAKINAAEDSLRVLRDKQREVKDSATTGAGQIDMLTDLMRLLQVRGRPS